MARGISTRRSAPAVRTAGGRAIPATIEFDSRTAWDFMASMGIGDAPEHDLVAVDREWLTTTRASLGDGRRASLDRLFGAKGIGIGDGLPLLVEERQEVRSGADVVRFVEALPAAALVTSVIGDCLSGDAPDELIERASIGDAGAIAELEPSLCAPEAAVVLREFTADAAAGMRDLRQLVRTWLAAFAPIEERIARIHATDIASRRAAIAELPPEEAIEAITGGALELCPSPPNPPDAARTDGVHVALQLHPPARRLAARNRYPVSDEVIETDSGEPSGAMVRLFRGPG